MKLMINILFIGLFIQSAYAFKGCKLNQFGHNICAGEQALLSNDERLNQDITIVDEVKILDHTYDTTIVDLSHKKVSVDINFLIGSKDCSKTNSDPICIGRKINPFNDFSPECINDLENKDYKIIESFETGHIRITDEKFGNKHSILIEPKCINLLKK